MNIFMIGGKARSGKDTLAKFLKKELEKSNRKVCIIKFSNYIKYYVYNYLGYNENEKPRKLLQELGTEIIRVKMNKNTFFIDRTLEDIEILSNYFDTFIISDVRYPIEYDKIKDKYPNTIKILIDRINFDNELSSDEKNHISETALDNYNLVDYKIINENLDNLEKDAIKIVNEVV